MPPSGWQRKMFGKSVPHLERARTGTRAHKRRSLDQHRSGVSVHDPSARSQSWRQKIMRSVTPIVWRAGEEGCHGVRCKNSSFPWFLLPGLNSPGSVGTRNSSVLSITIINDCILLVPVYFLFSEQKLLLRQSPRPSLSQSIL